VGRLAAQSCRRRALPASNLNPPPPNPANPSTPYPSFHNLGYYYPSTVRLPDGRVAWVGGGSDPLDPATCGDTGTPVYINGRQVLDRASGGWLSPTPTQWFPGLAGTYAAGSNTVAFAFHYYPLLTTIPGATPGGPGVVFAPVVTDNRSGNYSSSGYTPRRSPTALMPLTGSMSAWTWQVHGAQITKPGSTTPRNLYYPNGFLWPLHLDGQGRPTQPTRFVVLGGTDQNDYLSGAASAPPALPTHPDGGRPALAEVQTIDDPTSSLAAWTSLVLPPMQIARIYGSALVLPDEQLFVAGGAHYDFLPFRGQSHQLSFQRERTADPVFFPEMLDLAAPNPTWTVGSGSHPEQAFEFPAAAWASGSPARNML
jgi:hypothetical protein